MKEQKVDIVATVSTCALGAILLLYPLLGKPPYGYFQPMKYFVALAAGYAAVQLFRTSTYLTIISLVLVYLAWIEVFGKMRRTEWVPWNWAIVGAFVLSGILLVTLHLRNRKAHR